MEIDSFYQDGDMTFGMDGRISFADGAQFLRADGVGRAGEVSKWYPVSKDCTELENIIAKAKTDLKNNIEKLADPKLKRGEKRVVKDYSELIKKRIGELEDAYRRNGCAAQKKQAEETAFVETLKGIANPQNGQPEAKTPTKTTTYVMVGIVAVTLAGLTIFVMKKMKG